jgi:hypothetical protein
MPQSRKNKTVPEREETKAKHEAMAALVFDTRPSHSVANPFDVSPEYRCCLERADHSSAMAEPSNSDGSARTHTAVRRSVCDWNFRHGEHLGVLGYWPPRLDSRFLDSSPTTQPIQMTALS